MQMGKPTIATIAILLVFFLSRETVAQPQPGDVFREYMWYNVHGDADQTLRVGGKYDYGGGNITFSHDVDLEHAIKAEVVVEKILCHDSTRELAIEINDSGWIEIPEAEGIPLPQHAYQHHIYPSVAVPLDILKSGRENVFKMKVSTTHRWDWPQNLINGVHFRIYYDGNKKAHPTGRMVSPASKDKLGDTVTVSAQGQSPSGEISKIEYIGLYTDVNFEGDGIYYQWHYHYYHGRIKNHIGTGLKTPFEVEWNTSWVPDQEQPIQIAARIHDETGMIYMTEPVGDLKLGRDTISVELCKPYNIPTRWVTRYDVQPESFDVTGNPEQIIAARLVWSSWSPGYMNGISINNTKVFDREGPTYKYYDHRVGIKLLNVFLKGKNVLSTGVTPRINGNMVHGMEVNWPGIMVLLRYDKRIETSIESGETPVIPSSIDDLGVFPNPFNGSTAIRYTLSAATHVRSEIISLSGQSVRTLVDSFQEPGKKLFRWDGTNEAGGQAASGVYFAAVSAGNGQRVVIKMMYIR